MSSKHFELWLDESGDFLREEDKGKNPSLVGGVLIEKSLGKSLNIPGILGSEYIHSNEIKENFGDYAVGVLQRIVEHSGHLVIFENQERLNIVNSDTTYLNVISEGIIQLLQSLAAEHGKIHLDILIAVRLDMEKQDLRPGLIIRPEEYGWRLEERLILGLARRTLAHHKHWGWNINMDSARKNPKLMLADVVCN